MTNPLDTEGQVFSVYPWSVWFWLRHFVGQLWSYSRLPGSGEYDVGWMGQRSPLPGEEKRVVGSLRRLQKGTYLSLS